MTSIQAAISEIGLEIVTGIISLAMLLTKSDSSPGIVAAILILLLAIFGVTFWIRTSRQIRAIRKMNKAVREHADVSEFAKNYEAFRHQVAELGEKGATSKKLWEAWDEFSETIVLDDVDETSILRNSIRPSSFLNTEDLGFGPGTYRILPATFVSTGLLLTFLGLVAALHQFTEAMGTTGGPGMEGAMQGFMQIASAKFTMSLVGLFCSILFTLVLRHRTGAIDKALHSLCFALERRLIFVSLEDLGFRQLKAATEQREHLREIGMSMVAELKAPLDKLPESITQSISDKMDPIFDKVTSLGTSNMEGLVGDLSSQLSHSVGNALTRASESLGEATDRIGLMVDRMNQSNDQAGSGLKMALDQMAVALADLRKEISASGEAASSVMNEGAERLLSVMNDTLKGIRDNTAQGAEAMSAAADDLRKSAEGFRHELTAATEDGAAAIRSRMAASSADAGAALEDAASAVLQSFDATGQKIAELGTRMGGEINDELMGKLGEVSKELNEVASAIERGASGTRQAADGMTGGAEAMKLAALQFGHAGSELVAASEPLRASHERIEAGIRELGQTVSKASETVTQSSRNVAEKAANVLETAQVALGDEREGIRSGLEAVRAAIGELSQQAEDLDKIDEMLGRALTQYNSQLDAALGSAQDHITTMRDILEPGITTLQAVVEQAENFMPTQQRRG